MAFGLPVGPTSAPSRLAGPQIGRRGFVADLFAGSDNVQAPSHSTPAPRAAVAFPVGAGGKTMPVEALTPDPGTPRRGPMA